MFISRALSKRIQDRLQPKKVIIITGARRVGKTELLRNIHKKTAGDILFLNGEDAEVAALLANRSVANYRRLLDGVDLLIIDEAQVIPRIGSILKLMVDEVDNINIIVSGSSSFDLTNDTGEPLTGRKYEFTMYPLAQAEFSKIEDPLQTNRNLEERLILGSYPELATIDSLEKKKDYLHEIVNSYLLKDILAIGGIKKSAKMNQLLNMVARQVGQEVSYQELAKKLGMSKNTVERYLDLLSKVYVLYRLKGYSKNLRKEITKNDKWFFMDNGIRNALINDFRFPAQRDDMGLLWENYILSERIKFNSFRTGRIDYYFWRTYDQQEIDFLEVEEQNLRAFECKFGGFDNVIREPGAFARAYPDADFNIIRPTNYLDFIT